MQIDHLKKAASSAVTCPESPVPHFTKYYKTPTNMKICIEGEKKGKKGEALNFTHAMND